MHSATDTRMENGDLRVMLEMILSQVATCPHCDACKRMANDILQMIGSKAPKELLAFYLSDQKESKQS